MCVYALRVRLSWQHNNNVFRFKPALFCITFYKHWGIECTVNQHYFYSLYIILVTCSSLFKFSIEFPQYFMTLLLCLFNFYVWFSQKNDVAKINVHATQERMRNASFILQYQQKTYSCYTFSSSLIFVIFSHIFAQACDIHDEISIKDASILNT